MVLNTAPWVVWGFRNGEFDTFRFFQNGFYRALKYMGKDVRWLDALDDVSDVDFSECIMLTEGRLVKGMPEGGFHIVHNGRPEHPRTLAYGLHSVPFMNEEVHEPLGPGAWWLPRLKTAQIMWPGALLPHEYAEPQWFRDTRVIHYVGTRFHDPAFDEFERACRDHGVEFRVCDQGSRDISVDGTNRQNMELIQASVMAPTICWQMHLDTGVVPDRLWNNISFGCWPVTNSPYVRDAVQGRCVYNPNSYALFDQALHELPHVRLDDLRGLQADTARDHTYVNRITALLEAAGRII